MLENNHNSECSYAEQIVSLLYGEISGAEKSDFETHLKNCAGCAAEMADFSALRFSINEWRSEEFDNLSAPIIKIPEIKSASTVSNSWFDSLRQIFAIRSVGFSAAALAAILVVCGFFWISSSSGVKEVAENRSVKTPEVVHNSVAEKIPVGKTAEIEETKEIAVSLPEPQNRVSDSHQATNAVKVNVRKNAGSVQNTKSDRASMPVKSNKNNEKAVTKKSSIENMPTLAVEEYEDKSLRLSDIFEEVSLK